MIPIFYKYKIETELSKTEIEKRIMDITILDGESNVFMDVNKYYFYHGIFKEQCFSFIPLPFRVPLYGRKNSFLPKVTGRIKCSKGKNIVEIEICVTWISIISFLVGVCFLVWSFFDNSRNIFQWLTIFLVLFLCIQVYFICVKRKIIEILKNVMSLKKV